MSSHPENWTSQGLLAHIRRLHQHHPDHRFAFVLGAGASVSSGIPAGKELVDGWLRELHERWSTDECAVEDWATATTLGIEDFDYANRANFYPQVFAKRFNKGHEKEGYESLGHLMDKAEPSFGYSVLAQILSSTRHNVVVTTNFDNLVADAMATYVGSHPLMVGHESLAGYARARLNRPLVAKIHRDLFIDPINDPCGTATLANGWDSALTELFKQCTPIVIGYGGNDGSLMGFLERLPERHLPGGLFWTYRKRSGPPSARIVSIVARHGGALVPILGFDEFLLELREPLGLTDLSEQIDGRAKELPQRYRTRRDELLKRISDDQETARQRGGVVDAEQQAVWEAAGSLSEQEQNGWRWNWLAVNAADPVDRELIYRRGLQALPSSPELHVSFADFMTDVREDHAAAEAAYRRALELNPSYALAAGNFANFMRQIRKDNDEAERLYRRALELDPSDSTATGNFATFLTEVREDHDEAERLFRRALAIDPNDAFVPGNFAIFLRKIRKNYDEAERMYRRALALHPSDANALGNLANFMTDIRKDNDEAERLYRRALELDPSDSTATGNFATFLTEVREDHDEAERLFRRALAIDPNDAFVPSNFAIFLRKVRKNYDEAERMYRRALALDPSDANAMGNLANFMTDIRNDHDEAERLYRRALELSPSNSRLTGDFANFMADIRKDYGEAGRLYLRALVLDPGNATATGNFATFMWTTRKDPDEAERLYRRALELSPGNATTTGNFAGFMLAHREVAEFEALAREALRLHVGSEDQLAAELNFYLGLAARLQGQDDRSALQNLHRLLTVGFKREPWTFEGQLQRAEQSLADDELRFYRALAVAILDPAALPGLAELPRWQAITAASGTS